MTVRVRKDGKSAYLNMPLIDARTSIRGRPSSDRGIKSNPTIRPVDYV